MKKLKKAMIIGMSCALAVSLVACGDDGKSGNSKAPNPSSIKTERVDEAGWISAMDFSDVTNYTVKFNAEGEEDGINVPYESLSSHDGYKLYTYENEDDVGNSRANKEKYFSYENGDTYYYYKNDSNRWEKDIYDDDELPYADQMLSDYAGMLTEMYDYFEYSAKASAYIMTFQGIDFTVKIKNGKLSVVTTYDNVHEYNPFRSTTLQVYNVGSTSVTLPRVTGSTGGGNTGTGGGNTGTGGGNTGTGGGNTGTGGGNTESSSGSEVTRTQWANALSSSAFTNCTFRTINSDLDDWLVSKIDTNYYLLYSNGVEYTMDTPDGRPYEYISDGRATAVYFRYDGDDLYTRYMPGDTMYNRYSYDNQITSTLSVFEMFVDMYSEFTFDDSTGKYIADNVELFDTPFERIEFVFENGKLSYFYYVINDGGRRGESTLYVYDYNSTVITLPAPGEYVENTNDPDNPDLPDIPDMPNVPDNPDEPSMPDDGMAIGEYQWREAFTENAFRNVTMTTINSMYGPLITKNDSSTRTFYTEEPYLDHETGEMLGISRYIVTQINGYDEGYYTRSDETLWAYQATASVPYEQDYEMSFDIFRILFADAYDRFEYQGGGMYFSSENFVINVSSDGLGDPNGIPYTYTNVRLRFEGGRLVGFYMELQGYGISSEGNLYDYGNTEIILPTEDEIRRD